MNIIYQILEFLNIANLLDLTGLCLATMAFISKYIDSQNGVVITIFYLIELVGLICAGIAIYLMFKQFQKNCKN